MTPESVWDYPRPPSINPTNRRITVELAGVTLADTTAAQVVKETSHPPVYYLPPGDVRTGLLTPSDRSSYCEFKGTATYWHFRTDSDADVNREVRDVAWSYPDPTPRFAALRGHLAFYPSKVDACTVDGERVAAQEGDFYGGWITPDVTGPFKGGPGSAGW